MQCKQLIVLLETVSTSKKSKPESDSPPQQHPACVAFINTETKKKFLV